MVRGGRRLGAGRKSGIPNSLTKELRNKINSEKLIGEIQKIAFGKKGKPTTSERLSAIIF
jgi:hypothetical protein